MSDFEIGQVYSRRDKFQKIYYMAISHKTLVTYREGRFGKFTTKKEGHISENNISVAELCEFWSIRLKDLDTYMASHFQPDDEAKQRARKEQEDQEQLQLLSI